MRPLDPLSSPHAPEDGEESRQNQGGGDPDAKPISASMTPV